MDHLVVCDGPDLETAVCEAVEASGIYVVGLPMAWPDLMLLLSACAGLVVTAWGFRLVADHIRGRR